MENSMLLHYGIKGMKWGVRRYQNKDGTLTAAGEKRYDRDKRENAAKKKENRIDLSNPDPKRWAKEDLERTKKSLAQAEEEVDRCRAELVEKAQERSLLDTLKEKQAAKHAMLERQKEQREFDETATLRFKPATF